MKKWKFYKEMCRGKSWNDVKFNRTQLLSPLVEPHLNTYKLTESTTVRVLI